MLIDALYNRIGEMPENDGVVLVEANGVTYAVHEVLYREGNALLVAGPAVAPPSSKAEP